MSDKEEKEAESSEDEKKEIEGQLKAEKEKGEKLEGEPIEKGESILVKITGKTQKGEVFHVSSEEDAKKAGIYDEQKAKQGHYMPEFIIVGEKGFLIDGLMETIEQMKYFEKKSVRIPPEKAFGKRIPDNIDRIGLARFRKMNNGKPPEIGQEFTKRTKQGPKSGKVTNVVQGRVIVDYNHPLAGQSLDYNIEILDKIEDFKEKIKYFMINKGIPPDSVGEFKIIYNENDKSLNITIPKMFLFQNLTYLKFGLAMDLQKHLSDKIDDVRFIEVYEKSPISDSQKATEESVMKKVKEYNEKQKEESEEEPAEETESEANEESNKEE
ncbi:MAG: Peptidylprolyl isomerase [Promethearchaeota archaeon]|nr:MAG: Peptidylprolyl isomerase [Candidatus Lokiarchaeota archaeon]